MDNLRNTIELLFSKRSDIFGNVFQKVDLNTIFRVSQNVDQGWFENTFCSYFPHYPKEDVSEIYSILQTRWLRIPVQNDNQYQCFNLSIYNILSYFNSSILSENNGEPICNFDQLFRWHELSSKLGEDLFTTSFFAYQDCSRGIRSRNNFSWRWHIQTNNAEINDLCKRGLSDIHYHLNVSTMVFDLNWISLMNVVIDRTKCFDELKESLSPHFNSLNIKKTPSLQALCLRAAVIRAYLFGKLQDKKDKRISSNINKYLKFKYDDINIFEFDIQNKLTLLNHQYGKNTQPFILNTEHFFPDYANPESFFELDFNSNSHVNNFFYGERSLMYHAFFKIYSGNDNNNFSDLFYEYLLIKSKFRSELIQLNDRIGFANFSDYQSRKNLFIQETKYAQLASYLAIHGSFADKNVKYIEAKLNLGNTPEKISKTIKENDKLIFQYFPINKWKKLIISYNYLSEIPFISQKEQDAQFYYILQLSKRKEQFLKFNYSICKSYSNSNFNSNFKISNKINNDLQIKNFRTRINVKQSVIAYNEVRKSNSNIKKRIVGIDAVSAENGCRPEVFAQGYRYLRNFSYPSKNPLFKESDFTKAGFIYHVGEDFQDLTDGLRAIDEALRFLELQRGDRIGHALALGIDSKEYYIKKKNTVILSKQNILDNIVWVIYKTKEYGIVIPPEINMFFFESFHNYFNELYGKRVNSLKDVNSYIYYQSMLLRGDNPDLYQYNHYSEVDEQKHFTFFWDTCGLSNKSEIKIAREYKNARKLFYYYHKDSYVKITGEQCIEFKYPEHFYKIIDAIQKAMMKQIATEGIAIETNPSSNYLIMQLKKYDQHPITKFFNLGLTYKEQEIAECPQISVSINTDDQGLFSTSLENEYALMALALKKKKDPDGNPIYTERMIYDWLERIRIMGNQQRFKK